MYDLNICIPTFNRKDKVVGIVKFFLNEFKHRNVCITVQDNASVDGTYFELTDMFSQYENVFIHKNGKNIGLGGNINILYRCNISRYIWVVGDDDDIEAGICDYMFKEFESKPNLACFFINHRALNKDGSVIFPEAYSKSNADQDKLVSVFKEKGSVMMFLSSMLYKVDSLQLLLKEKPNFFSGRLTLPLFVSLAMSETFGSGYMRDSKYIANIHGDTSWSRGAWKVFVLGVPAELLRLGVLTGKVYPIYLLFRYLYLRASNKFKRILGS